MPSPLGEGQTDMPIKRLHLGEVLHPNTAFHPSALCIHQFTVPSSPFFILSHLVKSICDRNFRHEQNPPVDSPEKNYLAQTRPRADVGTWAEETMSKRNICPICGGNKVKGTTAFTVDLGFGVVVVRDVPTHVCDQCGTDWIADETAERLEITVYDARKRHRQVEVTAYMPA